MSKKTVKKEDSRPAASFDVSYSTYENMTPQSLPLSIVDLRIEDFMTVEVGGWGTCMKIILKPGTKVELSEKGDVQRIYLTPPPKTKNSLFTTETLAQKIKGIVGE